MLAERPDGAPVGFFLPRIEASAPERELRCRTALATTFLAGLEMAGEGAVTLNQGDLWEDIPNCPFDKVSGRA